MSNRAARISQAVFRFLVEACTIAGVGFAIYFARNLMMNSGWGEASWRIIVVAWLSICISRWLLKSIRP